MKESDIVDTIIGRAARALKNKTLPSHDAFTISEVVGVCICMPKEYVLEEMIKKNK
jgi:hypothetical protein